MTKLQESDHPQGDNDEDEILEGRILDVIKWSVPHIRTAKNVAKVLCRLTTVGTKTIVAALEERTSRFELKNARNQLQIAQLSEMTTPQSAIEAKVTEHLIKEQLCIDQVVFEAIEKVQTSVQPPAKEDEQTENRESEIDDDWIESFRRVAAGRGQGEMRKTFIRILAGEIQEPGRFSIDTLQTVGALSQSTAELFVKAASLRLEVRMYRPDSGTQFYVEDSRVPSLDGHLGGNFLKEQGLGYGQLIKLTENNLLHHDYSSYYPCDFVLGYPKQKPMCRIFHQKHDWFLMPLPGFNFSNKLQISGAMFTTVGRQLLQIVDIEPDSAFLEQVRSYFKSHHLQMIAA